MHYYRNLFILIACMLGSLLSLAQKDDENSFSSFAAKQEKVFVGLYEKRDVKNYTSLLDTWLHRYNALPDTARRQFARYLANAYYNLSCTYALLGNKKPALDYLERTIRSGYTNYSHMMADKDLERIRREARFTALLQTLRATG